MWPELWVLVFSAAFIEASVPAARMAPIFTMEPVAVAQYGSRGIALHCAARASPVPTISWVTSDDLPLPHTNTIGRVLSNGTLQVFGTGAGLATRRDAVTLRCRAANAYGVILSRDVTLMPVSDESWEAVVTAWSVSEGGVAALRCGAGGQATAGGQGAEGSVPALWYRDERVMQLDAATPTSRYLQAGDTLLLGGVTRADAAAYSCVPRHALASQTRRSHARDLLVTPAGSVSAPRALSSTDAWSRRGDSVCLPCAAGDYPLPHYTWYRETSGRLQPITPDADVWLWYEGAALCITRVTSSHAGAWLCRARNHLGEVTTHARLYIADTLTVSVQPSELVVDAGNTVLLNCTVSDSEVRVSWYHDGATVAPPAGDRRVLAIREVTRRAAGVYQCVARRVRAGLTDSAHDSAEIRMGESSPELSYTFIEQAVRGGGSVSLRCAARAAPPPAFTWTIDDAQLQHYLPTHRFSVDTWSSASGEVVSVVNISALTAADGGRYTCRAHNSRGYATHSARLNVYGPAMIRSIGAARVVAGDNATIYCPYAGYPIRSVSWWRGGGAGAGVGAAGRVSARDAALRLTPAIPADAGHYQCGVTQADSQIALRRDILVQVRNPPKISPFIFSPDLTEGSSVQVLCGVSSGDKPVYFSWLKDGAPLPPDLQIEEKSLNEFSLLMFSQLSARHSGEYTCRVTNHAAAAQYSAKLTVQVAAAWTREPLDASVVLGAPLQLQCAARGHPLPNITWYRGISGTYETSEWEEIARSSWSSNEAGLFVRTSEERGERGVTLEARGAGRALQGGYRCVADNGVGPPLVKHVNVTVHEPAVFVEETTTRNVSAVRGADATLTCAARGDPPLSIAWSHAGQPVDLNSFRWSVTEAASGGGVQSTLNVRAVTSRDAGAYRCTAHNPHGRTDHLLFLTVQEPPTAVSGLRLAGVDSRWVRLSWSHSSGNAMGSAGGAGDAVYSARVSALHALPGAAPHRDLNLTHLRNDSVASNLVQLFAKIEDFRPASAYSVRVRAQNRVGASPYSDPLVFTTLDEAPSGPPLNVQVRVIGNDELHVTWSTPQQDSWNGELLGYVVSWRRVSIAEANKEDAGEESGCSVVGGWSSASLTLEGLQQFARYCVAVRAYSRVGLSPLSAETCHTLAIDGVPESAPSNVWCEALSASELRVRWSAPAAPRVSGYDVNYNLMHYSNAWSGVERSAWLRVDSAEGGTLPGLRAARNYSVSVRARSPHGPGPPSGLVHCATMDDGAVVRTWSVVPGGAGWLRVTWLPVQRATHYTIHTQHADKVGEEWTQRVEASLSGDDEVRADVRGLNARAHYSLRLRSVTRAGPSPPTRAVVVAPIPPSSARITSIARTFNIPVGLSARLPCAAVGPAPLRRRWTPVHAPHAVTDDGDLIIHKVELTTSGNYTCSVRGTGGTDAVSHLVRALAPRAPPVPRVLRAHEHSVVVAWDQRRDLLYDDVEPVLGYTIWLSPTSGGPPHSVRVAGDATSAHVSRLACGAPYALWLTVHAANVPSEEEVGVPERAVRVRTRGDKARAPPAREAVFANSSSLRVNLIAWRAGRCDVAAWSLTLRRDDAARWSAVQADASGDYALILGLTPGTWYLLRVSAHSPAGDSHALYRVPTLTTNGVRLGEPTEVSNESTVPPEGGGTSWEGREGTIAGGWGAGALLCGGAVGAVLAAVLLTRALRSPSVPAAPAAPVRPDLNQLYSTEPGKRNGKTLTPPDDCLDEISPYATFTMSGVQLRTFGRAEPAPLAAAAPAPHEYGSAKCGAGADSDTESSGSPCAACALELYRLPAAHLSDTLPAIESSTEDTSYSGGGGGRGLRGVGRGAGRRRKERPKHPPPVARYKLWPRNSARCE